ncbi:alkaline phosphatase family protein [bacterium]|nr:alkaline phosphatase family protein [bacterium]
MEYESNRPLSSRYLVIGLDGVTPEILEPMVENNELPTIKRLMEQGAYGHIRSALPFLSPVAWTSLSTGVTPAKHGITGFNQRMEGSYRTELFSSRLRRVKPVWMVLSETGKKVGVINVPMTYPPDHVNGIMISGLGTPGEGSPFTYPAELKKDLMERMGGFRFGWHNYKGSTKDVYIKELHNTIQNHFHTASYCMSEYGYDFFMAVFMPADEASHLLWSCMDKEHPSYNKMDAERFGHAIQDIYRALDLKAGELIKAFGDDATVVIVSDHGFGPLRKAVSINLLFEKLGYLRFNHPSNGMVAGINRFRTNVNLYVRKKKRNILQKLYHLMGNDDMTDKVKTSYDYQSLVNIDWSATKAYSMDDCGSIFINLKGREPQGIIEEGPDLERLKKEIKDGLLGLKDPENGRGMVHEVFFKEDIYSGDCIRSVPDILVVWERGYGAVSDKARLKRRLHYKKDSFFINHNWSGHHVMDGVFIISGPETRKGVRLEGIKLYDVTPTILYSMGLPLSAGLDGRAIKECFVRTIDEKKSSSTDIFSLSPSGRNELNDEEEAIVMEHLKSLGYLD